MLLDLLPQLGDEDKGTSLPGLYFPHNFIMKNFKHTENLKEFYSDYSHPHQLESTVNILTYFLYLISFHVVLVLF